MIENDNNEFDDSNSIMIRLKQIQKNGKVSITRDNISVFYQFLDNPSKFAKETHEYNRIITYDELVSLDSAINLLKNSKKDDNKAEKVFKSKKIKKNANHKTPEKEDKQKEIEKNILIIYNNYQECFQKAKELQNKIQILYSFGKTFVYEDYPFFEIECYNNILSSLDILIGIYKKQDQPEKPPFLTTYNLLYFGSLLQRKMKKKIIDILQKMFPNDKKEILESAYNKAISEKNINDPIRSSSVMFSNIYEKISPYIKYPEKNSENMSNMNHSEFDCKFVKIQEVLLKYFYNQNFLVIKVDTPVETIHVLKMISYLLYNYNRNHYFFENFFCNEDSDINSYFLDFEKDKYHLQTQYSFIIHPEYLSSLNQNILKEKIISRMTPIPDMTLQKFVIITSSFDFVFGKKPEPLNGQSFTCGETSMLVDSNLMRDYIPKGGRTFYFSVQIRQSLEAGNGKSTFINNEIEDFIKRNECKLRVFHHFIVDGNQRIPIESFDIPNENCKNIIHFQFNDEIMQRGIKFWSHLFQIFVDGFVLPEVGEPMAINATQCNLVIFEIPQLRGENNQPLISLSEFPLPISSKFPIDAKDSHSIFLRFPIPPKSSVNSDTSNEGLISIDKTIVNPVFESENDINQYYLYGIEYVVNRLTEKRPNLINNLKEYIELVQKIIFNMHENSLPIKISFRKYGYIKKYLQKYTKMYINSISGIDEEIDQNHFVAFFYLLTISSFYAYNCLPKEDPIGDEDEQETLTHHKLTFLTVNDLFSNNVKSNQKKIHFYTTRSRDEVFEPLKNFDFEIDKKYFTVCFNYIGENPSPKEALKQIFCSSEDYDKKFVQPFIKKNPQSYISRTQMTVPTLFRSSILLSRIFLSQPIILSGDTGCGKTASLMLLFEYFKLPVNDRMHRLNIEVGNTLNCHGGISKEDVINHLKEAPKSAKKHIIFFDELNTSPASSYIEHLLLNEKDKNHSKFVFIGAVNPFKQKNPISSNLTRVGLTQYIKGEEKKVNMIEKISEDEKNKPKLLGDNMSDMMYHVHRPQEATKDIIFDFNPICYEDKSKKEKSKKREESYEDDKFYPHEERKSIHLIIDNVAIYPNGIKRVQILNKLKEKIDICILFIRRLMNERAVISYRDIERTMIIYNKIFEFYDQNNKEVEDIDIPMITAIISFVLRLPNNQKFKEEDLIEKNKDGKINKKCAQIFNKVFKKYFGGKGDEFGKFDKGVYEINSRDKLLLLLSPNEQKLSKIEKDVDKVNSIMKTFMLFVYQYTFKYVQKDTIWKFQSTFIHIFIMDICIKCKLPCFIIGMPGTSKSYAVDLLKNEYKEKLYVSTYMSSRTSSPDGIKSQYYDATFKEIFNQIQKIKDNYCVVFIDEMGNANINPSRPLKFLHGILDHGLVLNETGYSNKVATIGVSNYTMDFANMNRGVLVYTGLPDLTEILTVFAISNDKDQSSNTKNVKEFIDYRENIPKENIKKIFDNLWPEGMPETIALRSIYSMQDLLSQENIDIHIFCRIIRELFNSKRLNEVKNGEPYMNLILECPQNAMKPEFNKINNLACFIERIACNDTASNKSLSLFTKNYEAIEYFELFENDKFIEFLQKQFKVNNASAFAVEKGKFKKFKYQLFAEDYKKSPDEISHDALTKIIECISNKDEKENVLFIGNHPCFDSCLDLLNVPHKKDQLEREVTLGSGFSSKFLLTNTDFYIMMIANIKDLQNISTSENPFSFAFLDRTETVYLDWEIIGPYYLRFRFKDLIKPKFSVAKSICKEIVDILNDQSKYETTEPTYLHKSIQSLYTYRKKINLDHEYTTELLKDRFNNGIKSVILTKSKILEKIYLPTEIGKESTLIENDTNIEDFNSLRKSIDSLKHDDDDDDKGEKLIIINCSKFDELHFAHLKTFFDEITDPSKSDIKYHIFIIYYGCDPKDFDGLSTFRWPIFAMEDISIHPELESKIQMNGQTTNEPKQLDNSEIQLMIRKMNHMDEDIKGKLCQTFFGNLFDRIIQYIENDIREKSQNKGLIIKTNYEKSEFMEQADFYDQLKQKFDANSNTNYFNIQIDSTSNISSTKSQIITQVYHTLCDVMQPFFLFRFGSSIILKKSGISDLEDFLLKSRYLDLPFNSFLINTRYDLYYYLFMDFFEFLITNKASFDENMRKRKLITDRVICASGVPDEVKTMFDEGFFTKSYQEYFKAAPIKFILNSKYEFDNSGSAEITFLQQYADFLHLRSLAGLNVKIHQTDNYWDKYINFCLFPEVKQDDLRGSNEKEKLTRFKIINSIAEFRNKSIFDIFISPVELEKDKFESSICKKLTSFDDYTINLELEDEDYQIYKEMNENPDSLKSDNRLNKLKSVAVTLKNKFTFLSMLMLNAESKWDGNVQNEIFSKFEGINNIKSSDLEIEAKSIDKIKNLTQDKFKSFGETFNRQYKGLDWYFKGDCLIDSIQTFLNKDSRDVENNKFRKWFLCGFDKDEPLSIIAFRRFLNSQTEYEKDLVNILDPFFGDKHILALFNDYIGDRIPEEGSFPMPRITDDNENVMKLFSFRNTFRFSTKNANRFYRLTSMKPYISQFVWFHVTFNKPSDYPLITLLIKESIFFTDFRVVPKIINSIVHLRHIFSYNPVFIPIILHCTSLFEDCECKLLLYSLGYFDTPNKDFENIQNELNTFKEFLELNYKDYYEILRKKSSYEQIKFILSMYYSKYNNIIEQINDYSNKANNLSNELSTINACDVLPNMLITNFTLNNLLLPILYKKNLTRFSDTELEISKIFTESECFMPFINNAHGIKTTFHLFKVLFGSKIDDNNKTDENNKLKNEKLNELKKDFLGFTPEDYTGMFQNHLNIGKEVRAQKLHPENASLKYHASILSFFLHLYLNKDDDDTSNYIDVKKYVNDISKTHMNTYASVINYDLVIKNTKINLKKNQLNFDKSIDIFFEENALYPLQRIFTLLPIELRNIIRRFQNQVKNGFNVIISEDDLLKDDKELLFEEEKKDEIKIDDDDEPED